jgi:hypothetical protein
MNPIPLRILNKVVTIKRTVETIGDTGSNIGIESTVYSNVPMRIVKARGDNKIKDQGASAFSSYIGMCQCTIIISTVETSLTILAGYVVADGSDRYNVDFVDSKPGGVSNHHQEIFMSILGK